MSIDTPEQTQIASKDGTNLNMVTFAEADGARGRLLFIHGWAEHAGRYKYPAEYLAPRGFSCYAMDVRGHGHSAGQRGYIDRYEEYVQDVHAGLQWVRERGGDSPTILIGHSQGGLVVARYVESRPESHDLDGFALSSPFLGLAMEVPALKRSAAHLMSRVWPGLALASDLDTSQLTKDQEVVRAYEEDPLIFQKARARWFTETLTAQDQALAQAGRIRLPCLVMHGADDGIANPAVTEDFFARCDAEDKTLKLYAGLRHEIFNEVEREQVFADVAAWLDDHCPAS